MPSTAARRYWSAVTIAGMALLVIVLLNEGPRRAAAGFILAAFVWSAGLLGQAAIGALVTAPLSRLARTAVGAFVTLPAVGLLVLAGAVLPSPLIDAAYVTLWVTGFVAFALLFFVLLHNAGR